MSAGSVSELPTSEMESFAEVHGRHASDAIEVRESHDGNAYRAVYTVRYADAVYVLHAFQKKSKKGIATPKAEIDLIEKRLKDLIKEKEERQ
jgi:phage-related protein